MSSVQKNLFFFVTVKPVRRSPSWHDKNRTITVPKYEERKDHS